MNQHLMKRHQEKSAEPGTSLIRKHPSVEWSSFREELDQPAPGISHPIPRLNRAFIPPAISSAGQRLNHLMEQIEHRIASRARAFARLSARRVTVGLLLLGLSLGISGCTVLSYTSATGERFSRGSFGANTSIASLSVATGTNGLRQIELRGYQHDSTQALSIVTEAAVRAALQGAK